MTFNAVTHGKFKVFINAALFLYDSWTWQNVTGKLVVVCMSDNDGDHDDDDDIIVRSLDVHVADVQNRTCSDLKWRNDDDEDKESSENAKLSSDAEGPSPSSNTPSKLTWHADVGTMYRD